MMPLRWEDGTVITPEYPVEHDINISFSAGSLPQEILVTAKPSPDRYAWYGVGKETIFGQLGEQISFSMETSDLTLSGNFGCCDAVEVDSITELLNVVFTVMPK